MQSCLQYLIHTDKVTDTAAQHKEMKDLMGTEVLVSGIEQRKLQCVNDTADGIDDASCEEPQESSVRQCVDQRYKYGQTCPAHGNI